MRFRLRFRLLSFLLVFILTAGNIAQVNVYADEKSATLQEESVKEESVKELSGLEITDLDEPVPGKALDTTATVRSSEGVTWEIPVVWIGEDGKAATIAEEGKKYVPSFAFYVPKGYTVKGAASLGIKITKLPAFLAQYGIDRLIYFADPANGLTYVTWNAPNIIRFPGSKDTVNDTSVNKADEVASEKRSSDDDSDDEDGDSYEDPYWEVNLHCAKNLIANVGYEVLASLVSLIKNEIEPRAIAALIEGFPAFSDAADNGELGSYIGLYVYDARFDSADEDQRNLINGSDAYVYGSYYEDKYYYMMAVNTSSLLIKNESGIYELSETALSEAKNFIIHELMHALMDDYTRTGNSSLDNYKASPEEPGSEPYKMWNSYPKWFIEGSASTVHHTYRYQEAAFEIMSVLFDENYVREEGDPLYTETSVIRAFRDPDPKNSTCIRIYRTDSGADIGGAYSGGYLAVIYLSLLVGNDGKDPAIPDNDQVRMGLSKLLTRLHDGESLNEIIKGTGKYKSLIDFENRFVSEGDESTRFVVDFLNHLDSCGTDDKRANGSILLSFDTDKDSPLDGRTETSNGQSVLLVVDESDPVMSTADDQKARNSAGAYHKWEDSDFGMLLDEELAAAAITRCEETTPNETVPEETASKEPAPEEPAPEEPAPEETAPEGTAPEETAPEETAAPLEQPSADDGSDQLSGDEGPYDPVPEEAAYEDTSDDGASDDGVTDDSVTDDGGSDDGGSDDGGSDDDGSDDGGSDDDGSDESSEE